MGRLSKFGQGGLNLKVHYRKLVDRGAAAADYGNCDAAFKIMPTVVPEYFLYCCKHCGHSQKLEAEELNRIVGNAFRMAYAAQLQKQSNFQDVIASQLDQTQQQADKVHWANEITTALKKDKLSHNGTDNMETIRVQHSDAALRLESRLHPPSTIPGLKPLHKFNVMGPSAPDYPTKSQSQQSTPNSEESNSPTELNSYKKMTEKPPLIKRIAMGLTGSIAENDEDSRPLVGEANTNSIPGSPTNRSISSGYVNETEEVKNKTNQKDTFNSKISESIHSQMPTRIQIDTHTLSANDISCTDLKSKRISSFSSSSSSSGNQVTDVILGMGLQGLDRIEDAGGPEKSELRLAPWYQAGIPREIALEILNQEPIGSFIVRESTTKQGCYALSLRVPRTFQPTGIAHYLIVRTNVGYKIQGFTKEFTTLSSLITHHSVMQELLPCPLSLSRYQPRFNRAESKRDFADIDCDPDYNALTDFRKMMADLNV